jgi:hypothetical protein
VHFESGLYYNIQGTGADICQYLMANGQVEQIVADLAQRFGLPEADVERDVRAFVETLARDGLIVRCDAAPNQATMKISARTYDSPRCEQFDDMADQLLLDKIDDPSKDAQWTNS